MVRHGYRDERHTACGRCIGAAVAEHVRAAEADGFASTGWPAPVRWVRCPDRVGHRRPVVQLMELGTAVIPTYPRHPLVLAGEARTVASAMAAPLTLGVGLSHQPMRSAGWPTTSRSATSATISRCCCPCSKPGGSPTTVPP